MPTTTWRAAILTVAALAFLSGCAQSEASPIAAGGTPGATVASVHTAAPVDPNAPKGQCRDADLVTTVIDDPYGSGAGQRLATVDFRNRGHSSCVLRGTPGVSLVGHGNGTQLGRPADHPASGAPATVRLAPGTSARAALQFVNVDAGGGPYDGACHAEKADGYRVFAPHSFRAVFVRAPQYACTNTRIHWGSIGPVLHVVGCATTAAGMPKGAAHRRIADFDGDGLPDTEWFSATRFGITTASGATTSVQPALSGAATPRGLAVRLSQIPAGVALVAGSRDVQLFRLAGCRLQPVVDRHGQQWRFDLTGRYGSGVGCDFASSDGRDHLIGTELSKPVGALRDGDRVRVASTVIDLDGLHASAGATTTTTFTWPADRALIRAAASVTCHATTLAKGGVSPRHA